MYYVLIFEFLKHWASSISFGSTGAGLESRTQEIGSGGGGKRQICRSYRWLWSDGSIFLAFGEAQLRCRKRNARLSFPSPELISLNLPPCTCGERFELGTTTPPSVRLKLDGK